MDCALLHTRDQAKLIAVAKQGHQCQIQANKVIPACFAALTSNVTVM
jgi:hypothetical protein